MKIDIKRSFLYKILQKMKSRFQKFATPSELLNYKNNAPASLGDSQFFSSYTENLERKLNRTLEILDKTNPNILKKLDKENVRIFYEAVHGLPLNLDNPKTFNEKIQWYKINYRNSLLTKCADKYKVREYIKEKGLSKYLNDLLGVYTNVEDLKKDIKKLPNKFVIKCNHWCGDVIVVKDKNTINWDHIEKSFKLLKENYYWVKYQKPVEYNNILMVNTGEWAYKDIEPVVVVENYLEDSNQELLDYKVFCFNGKPKFIQIDKDRFTNHTRCYYDLNWVKQDFSTRYPVFQGDIKKPDNLEKIIKVSEKLSSDFPFVRVDLYNINDKRIIFGELTFYHGGGSETFHPSVWDKKLGDFWKI